MVSLTTGLISTYHTLLATEEALIGEHNLKPLVADDKRISVERVHMLNKNTQGIKRSEAILVSSYT